MSADRPTSSAERASMLQDMPIARAADGTAEDTSYPQLRAEFMGRSNTATLVPPFVCTSRNLDAFWDWIRDEGTSYSVRRRIIWEAFAPLLDYLEDENRAPADPGISATLDNFDEDGVHRAWTRALDRRQSDPEGAITAARTLLEAVCKRILDEAGEAYAEIDDLPKLYGRAAHTLNLAPSQHTEPVFRTILGGCQSVVNSLGTLRNRIGDAHGRGGKPVRPSARHATLAVNLAGTIATFTPSVPWASLPATVLRAQRALPGRVG